MHVTMQVKHESPLLCIGSWCQHWQGHAAGIATWWTRLRQSIAAGEIAFGTRSLAGQQAARYSAPQDGEQQPASLAKAEHSGLTRRVLATSGSQDVTCCCRHASGGNYQAAAPQCCCDRCAGVVAVLLDKLLLTLSLESLDVSWQRPQPYCLLSVRACFDDAISSAAVETAAAGGRRG